MGAFSSKGNIPVTRLHTLNEQTTSTMRQLSLLLLLSVAMLCSASTLRVKRDAMAKYCRHHQDCETTQACSQNSGLRWSRWSGSRWGTCRDLCFCENCDKGVNNARDVFDSLPLHQAAKNNNVDVAKLLLENSADVDSTDNYGETALHDAALWNSVDVAKLLLENSANVDSANNEGATPLHVAARKNSVGVAEILIAHSANLNATTAVSGRYRDKTPLQLAEFVGNQEMVELLRNA